MDQLFRSTKKVYYNFMIMQRGRNFNKISNYEWIKAWENALAATCVGTEGEASNCAGWLKTGCWPLNVKMPLQLIAERYKLRQSKAGMHEQLIPNVEPVSGPAVELALAPVRKRKAVAMAVLNKTFELAADDAEEREAAEAGGAPAPVEKRRRCIEQPRVIWGPGDYQKNVEMRDRAEAQRLEAERAERRVATATKRAAKKAVTAARKAEEKLVADADRATRKVRSHLFVY
jgi:hypothetical protein